MNTWTNLLRAAALLAFLIPFCLPADTILDDFQVNTEFPGHPPQDSPYSVANWQTQRIYTTFLSQHDGTNWDVALARHNYNLEPVGQTTYLNIREGSYNCLRPKLVIRSTGVGAAWIESRSPNRILFRSLDGNGNPTCPPVRAEDDFSNVLRDSLSIAALYDGFLLVWYDGRDSSKIWAQKVNLSGQLMGPNFPIQPDSAGSILGLEAQNHPDGRVLVSWVTNGQYSRGRWLDSLGNFMGEVFEMAEPSPSGNVWRAKVNFAYGENTGLLYQYSYSWDINKTYLDSMGMQSSPWLYEGAWHGEEGSQYFWDRSFPSLLCLPDSDLIQGFVITASLPWFVYYSEIFSSLSGLSVHPLGLPASYGLCLLSPQTFLYLYDPSEVALQKYDVTLLNSSSITWVAEPGFGISQSSSDLGVHQDGSFRVIFHNWFSIERQLYTRYYNLEGMPSGADTIISLSEGLLPVITDFGAIEITSIDQMLVAWRNQGAVYGTLFDGQFWCQGVNELECTPSANFRFPRLDLNSSNHVLTVWMHSWYSWSEPEPYSQLYCRAFDQLYSGLYEPVAVTPAAAWYENPHAWDVSLRNDGRFVVCWGIFVGGDEYSVIYSQPGTNYHEIIGTPILISPFNWDYVCSPPVADKSSHGYWITWTQGNLEYPSTFQMYLRMLDSDGTPVGEFIIASSGDAIPCYGYLLPTCDIAASPSDNFAIVWQDARSDAGDVYCRQFNPDGSFFGNEYRVNSDPVGVMQKEPAVAFGPEDRLYFTWTDFRNPGGQGDIYCKVIEWADALDAPLYQPPLPKTFALYPPSPNPFNAVTVLRFQLPVSSNVTLEVFDISGREVGARHASPLQASGSGPEGGLGSTTPTTGWYEAGSHQVLFDGSDLASGIYIARLQAGDNVGVQKLVLLK